MNAVARDIEDAAEDVRRANHSTMRGVLDGPECCVVVGNLVELLQRLPQVVGFLSRSLRRADPDEHRDDRGLAPDHALSGAHTALDGAREGIGGVVQHLNAAHIHLGHIGRQITED